MNNKKHLTFVIPAIYANERIDLALAKLMPDFSRTQIQAWIHDGNVLVNDHPVKTKYKVKGEETVIVDAIIKEPPPQSIAQPIPLTIVHEDDDVIVINKPAGLVVHPGAGNTEGTLLNALLHHAPALRLLPRAGILHRLDKNTSGLLIIAKTPAALSHLSHQLKKRTLLREYQAVVYGTLISGGTVDAPIDRHPLQRKRMAVATTGKKAITHYRVAEKFRSHTVLKVRLETGRTHQIRVHMSHIHHPLIGDTAYGGRFQPTKGMTAALSKTIRQFRRQALHAFALGITHPTTEEFIRWEIPLPNDMIQLIASLRDDTEQFSK